jgi:hypothetical protein
MRSFLRVAVVFLLTAVAFPQNDEGHGFARRKNQDYQFYATVTFVKDYLLR